MNVPLKHHKKGLITIIYSYTVPVYNWLSLGLISGVLSLPFLLAMQLPKNSIDKQFDKLFAWGELSGYIYSKFCEGNLFSWKKNNPTYGTS